jgi:hypothetical protein
MPRNLSRTSETDKINEKFDNDASNAINVRPATVISHCVTYIFPKGKPASIVFYNPQLRAYHLAPYDESNGFREDDTSISEDSYGTKMYVNARTPQILL